MLNASRLGLLLLMTSCGQPSDEQGEIAQPVAGGAPDQFGDYPGVVRINGNCTGVRLSCRQVLTVAVGVVKKTPCAINLPASDSVYGQSPSNR